MDKDRGKAPGDQALFAGEAWFDPIEAGLRGRIRGLIEELVEQELDPTRGTSQRNAWPPQAVCPLGTRTRNPSGPAAAVPRQQAGHTTAIAPQPGSPPRKAPLAPEGPSTQAIYRPILLRMMARITAGPERVWHPPKAVLAALRSMHRICGGLVRIRRDMEPA